RRLRDPRARGDRRRHVPAWPLDLASGLLSQGGHSLRITRGVRAPPETPLARRRAARAAELYVPLPPRATRWRCLWSDQRMLSTSDTPPAAARRKQSMARPG